QFSPAGDAVAWALPRAARIAVASTAGKAELLTEVVTPVSPNSAAAMAFSPDGGLLAAAANRTIRVWDTQKPAPARVFTDYPADIAAVAFSPDSRWLAASVEHPARTAARAAGTAPAASASGRALVVL